MGCFGDTVYIVYSKDEARIYCLGGYSPRVMASAVA